MKRGFGWTVGAGIVLVVMGGPASALEVRSPRDGATVREKVRIVVPHSGIPQKGFAGLYIDGEFIAAQALPIRQSQPIVFVWDTKLPRATVGLAPDKRDFADGEHVLEIRSYDSGGNMVDRDQVSVLLNNRVPTTQSQPVRLAYKFRPDEKTTYVLRTEIESTTTNTTGGVSPYGGTPGGYPGAGGYPGPGAFPGGPGGGLGGPPGIPGDEVGGAGMAPGMLGAYPRAGSYGAGANPTQKYLEFRKVSEFVADAPGTLALMRELWENPITMVTNGAKQPVYVSQVSRYYRLSSQGDAVRTNAMERERRQPVYNVIRLPADSVRVGDQWKARVNISLGAAIPQRIEVMATNVVEAVEWEQGSPTARIRSTYEWNGKLSVPPLGVGEGICKFKGTSIIHFAPGLGKPMRAVHDIDGDLTIDLSRRQSPGGVPGLPGGGIGPGMMPGGMPGGYGGPGMGGRGAAEGGYAGPAGAVGYTGAGGGGFAAAGLAPQEAIYKMKIHATMTALR